MSKHESSTTGRQMGKTLDDTHLRVVHVNGDIFSFRPASLFPNGYGGNNTPFEINFDFLEGDMSSYAEVEFVVKENEVVGFGIFGYVPGDVKLRKGGSVEEGRIGVFQQNFRLLL